MNKDFLIDFLNQQQEFFNNQLQATNKMIQDAQNSFSPSIMENLSNFSGLYLSLINYIENLIDQIKKDS